MLTSEDKIMSITKISGKMTVLGRELMNDERVFIGLGSNLGNSGETLLAAWKLLDEVEGIDCVRLSSPYVTAPVDMHSQHWFTNAVGALRTMLTPKALLAQLLKTEALLGRIRKEQVFGYQDRPIDLDIIYFGERLLDEPDLDLPHPHLYTRLFVLTPLVEIAADFVDIQHGIPVAELERRLVEKIRQGGEKEQPITRSRWEEQ